MEPSVAVGTMPVLADSTWQMAYGERLALEGLLTQVRPRLAVEIGTAEGGSLRRIATHSAEVHSFDVNPDVAAVVDAVPNATAHIGDSAELLPRVLAEFEAAGRNVDFVLIDGDHTYEGVQRDMRAVLESGACSRTVVVAHDSANDHVRDGLEALDLPAHRKVTLCLLDFVPGYLVVEGHETYSGAIWNGLALVLLDGSHSSTEAIVDADHENVSAVYRAYRERPRP